MHVLAVGGTGFIGRHLCEQLVDAGHAVTALSRRPDRSAVPDEVTTTRGDVTEYASIAGAFEGVDAVINLVALSPLFEPAGGNERHDDVHRGGTENCLRAARGAGVERFVQLSALGADPSGPTHYLRAKGRAEGLVRESGLDWTILRPSVVFGDGGEFLSFVRRVTPPVLAPLPGGGSTQFQPIHVRNTAALIVAALGEAHAGETYELGGPAVLTLAEIAQLVRGADGRTPSVVSVPMGLAGAGLKLADAVPGVPFGTDQYRALRLDNTTQDNAVEQLGYSLEELTTVQEYLAQ